MRVVLRSPDGGIVTRDIRDGLWSEPDGEPGETLGNGQWALPGLADGHAHLARETLDYRAGDPVGSGERARLALESGVGLVLDKGWRDTTVVDMIDEIDPALRPDIEAAGVILAVEDGYVGGFCRNVAHGELAAAVGRAASEGRGWVKLIGDWPRKGRGPLPNFTEGELAGAVDTAGRNGARVAVHAMAREVPSMAVRAGVQSIEHGLFLGEGDLDAFGSRRGIWVPTVLRVDDVIAQLGAGSSGGRLLSEGLENVAGLLGPAVEAGVHVLTGTDLAVGSHQVAAEAIRLWEMGMPARAVIDAVSSSAYSATGRPHRFEPGTAANVVLFDENPLADPRVLAHPARVVRHGRVVR